MNRHGDAEQASTSVTDVCFVLTGGAIEDDYALALERAVKAVLPWLDDEPSAGILPLAGLGRGGDGVRYIGRRSRLVLRVPQARATSADLLCGRQLDLGGEVTVGRSELLPLFPSRVVHSPFVAMETDDEIEFLARCKKVFEERQISPQMVTGKARQLRGAGGEVHGFSLMLHGLSGEQTVSLQETGLGAHHGLGCGLFVPHKSVAAVGE